MGKKWIQLSLVLILLVTGSGVYASHIKGGYLEIVKTIGTTVTFRFNAWRDTGVSVEIGGGKFIFSDGNELEGPFSFIKTPLAEGVELVSIEVEHTFPALGEYKIGYMEEFRNADVLNVTNSMGTPFYTEISFALDPLFFSNQYQRLDPNILFEAQVGKRFESAITASDADGDLLTYHRSMPLQGANKVVADYRFPDIKSFYSNYSTGSSLGGSPSFEISKYTGNLTWDAPGDASIATNSLEHREYTVAIEVKEWKDILGNWYLMSTSQIDFNLDVVDEGDSMASATFPWELCQTNQPYELTITTDHEITLEVDLPFLNLQNGDPANNLDGTVLAESTTFLLVPNSTFENSGQVMGSISLNNQGVMEARYNVLYSDNCDLLQEYQVINGLAEQPVDVLIYPNPTEGSIQVNGIVRGELRIFSLSGQLIFYKKIVEERQSIDLPKDLKIGVYLAIISSNGRNFPQRLVVR